MSIYKAFGFLLTFVLLASLQACQAGKKEVAQAVMNKRVEAIREETAQQNEAAVSRPTVSEAEVENADAYKNVYFGDAHVHTALSFDAYLSGNRMGLDAAYRFARGEPLTMVTGEVVQIDRPLDFVVMADHAESFGLFVTCQGGGLSKEQKEFCAGFDVPSKSMFQKLREDGERRPPVRPSALCGKDLARCLADANTTWGQIRDAADEFNSPGQFTAFAGYEYSPPLPKQGKIHRNVVFRNSTTPARAVSAFEAATVLDLWRSLEEECVDDCEFLTIPHNMNKSWGIAYSGKTIDGDAYSKDDWVLRKRSEPLAEIFQAKGSSECGLGAGAVDEECSFELNVPVCAGEPVPGCSGKMSFAREGLKIGLALEQDYGFNPLQFGFIGSTDTHNSNPGDTEEYDWRGASGLHESPAARRLHLPSANKMFKKAHSSGKTLKRNPGGLAAVWAQDNTRDAIFDAMRQRETYATSGTRIKLHFFAGWNFPENMIDQSDFIQKAYDSGIAMGGILSANEQSRVPAFLVSALKDPATANLQRIQMVKLWMEDGIARESVFDIACSDGLAPNPITRRCPDNGAVVDVNTCKISDDKGDGALNVVWRDPQFNAQQAAAYYVRVLENPSCRWSSYDALRLGIAPVDGAAATIQERAWSSPIWYQP